MTRKKENFLKPYVGVIIVFCICIVFFYQSYQKDKIAERMDVVTKKIHIHEDAKALDDNLTSLNGVSKSKIIADQKQALEANIPQEVAGKIVFTITGFYLPVFEGANQSTLSLGAGVTYYKDAAMGKGNYILAGYNVNTPSVLFSDVSDLSIGEEVDLVDSHYKYQYEMTKRGVISDYDQLVNTPEKQSFLSLPKLRKKPLLTLLSFKASDMKSCEVLQGELINVEEIHKGSE